MIKIDIPIIIRDLFDIDDNLHNYRWEPFKEGIDIHRLYEDGEDGPSAALLRYAAGAQAPLHMHTGFEHILILSGSQSDGINVYTRGMLLISAPGTQHHISSESGCIALAIWQRPVSFIHNI